MLNVRLAGDHLYEKWLFTWLSLVMYLMVSYLCCLFPHEMSWMRYGTKLSQFLRNVLPSFKYVFIPFENSEILIVDMFLQDQTLLYIYQYQY